MSDPNLGRNLEEAGARHCLGCGKNMPTSAPPSKQYHREACRSMARRRGKKPQAPKPKAAPQKPERWLGFDAEVAHLFGAMVACATAALSGKPTAVALKCLQDYETFFRKHAHLIEESDGFDSEECALLREKLENH